ncbi:MAG: GntR family transcriptional regulator/MocR family aminotransferase [Motiliproteus sp.]|jgi:GntR family transcriptional regulator/MocR family aminotransferase
MKHQLFQPLINHNGQLQVQIREQLVAAILDGCLDASTPLPPSRKLAQQLHVGRNTVVNVYERLLSEGYLVSRERSGYFVNPTLKLETAALAETLVNAETTGPLTSPGPDWGKRLHTDNLPQNRSAQAGNWKRFDYPFIYNQLDPKLFPVNEWRECCRDSVRVRDIQDWSSDHDDGDDRLLIEQIRKRILPRRGIIAKEGEVLITLGSQHGLYLLSQLLLDGDTTLGIEDPGYPQVANIARLQSARIKPLEVDDEGLVVSDEMNDCQLLYTTPSHQCPTTVTLSLERRHQLLKKARDEDLILIEDDYESEINFDSAPTPALKCLDSDGRVIYLGSLSKTLAPGLRIGILVGPAALITRARQLRHLMLKHPPVNNQRAVALFIKRGFHDSLTRKLATEFKTRCQNMSAALETHFSGVYAIPEGGSSIWIRLPNYVDSRRLKEMAREQGILLQSGDFYFQRQDAPKNFIKLGFSAISADRIEPGIAKLAELLRTLQSSQQ